MKISLPALPAAVVIALHIFSCAPRPAGLLLDVNATPANVLLDFVSEREARVATVKGSGTVSFDSPEIAGTASFEVSLKKPDSLLVMLEGPFGIDIGTFFLSRDKYIMYNSFQNTVVAGAPIRDAIRSVIPFDIEIHDLLSAFSGGIPLRGDVSSLIKYHIEGNAFFLSFSCGGRTCNYWVDGSSLLVERSEILDAANNVVMSGEASRFGEEGEINFARRIVVRFPQDDRQLAVTFTSLRLNSSVPDFSFSIPDNARVINR